MSMRRILPRSAYVLLSMTWGLPLTLAGALTFLVLMAAGKRVKRFGYCYFISVRGYYGKRFGCIQ